MNTLPIVLYLLSQGFRLHKSLAIQISYRMYVSTWDVCKYMGKDLHGILQVQYHW